MTIKQMIVGVVLSTSIVGLLAHRLHKDKEYHPNAKPEAVSKLVPPKANPVKIASASKRRPTVARRKTHNRPYFSTRKTY